MGQPVQPPGRSVDLQVFMTAIAAIVLVAGLVTGVSAITGDDDGSTPDTTSTPSTSGATGTTEPGTVGSTEGNGGTAGGNGANGAGGGNGGGSVDDLAGLAIETLVTELEGPSYLTSPVGDDRLFVVQKTGRIFPIVDDSLVTDAFLDIRDRVGAGGIEQGLLGLAFHPDYAANGRFFVYYTNTGGNRRLSEFTVSEEPDVADAASERILIELQQPPRSTDIRHYGGMVLFGPDGYLYVSLGDGANASDQGQDPHTLFATIIRIDVDSGDPYGIPPDNPFADGVDGAPEVWAYGVRNPWRFTIDPVDGWLVVADVGLETQEEVDILSLANDAGANLGWPNVEGDTCFREANCDPADYHLPAITYPHEDGQCSVTGGHVYRGRAIPELVGQYLYTDWCAGWVKSFRIEDGAAVDEHDWTDGFEDLFDINAFGVDSQGELYVLTHEGTIARIVAAE
jgi:glucose/arabinose dehydrogenase